MKMPKLSGVWKHTCHLKNKDKLGYAILLQPDNNHVACLGSFYAESTRRKKKLSSVPPFDWSGFGKIVDSRLSLTFWNEIDEGVCDLQILDGAHLKGVWKSARRKDQGEEEYEKNHDFNFIAPFNPIFSDRAVQNDKIVFVLMPFAPQFRQIYNNIKKAVTNLKMQCLRADEIDGPGAIMKDIWKSILLSRVIVAELTGRNPNVFYELGIAHCVGKEVILISQSVDDIPFDLRHMRTVIYSDTKGLQKKLLSAIKSVID
jgi:hypothetical protein